VRYKLVIFDFDGTLVDSFPWFVQVLNDVADRYRFRRVDPHQAEALRGQSAREMIRYLGIPAWKMPLIARHMRKRKAEALMKRTCSKASIACCGSWRRAAWRLPW